MRQNQLVPPNVNVDHAAEIESDQGPDEEQHSETQKGLTTNRRKSFCSKSADGGTRTHTSCRTLDFESSFPHVDWSWADVDMML